MPFVNNLRHIMKPVIILVSPQMGENIGASARAMKNFGLSDLRIVSPRDGWPNEKAENMSVGAIDIIHNAKLFDNLADAIADLNFVFAATATPRDMNKDYILSKDIAQSNLPKGKMGIMFGRESSGLSNEEISAANQILTINTDKEFSSLNIAHSVAVIGYEFYKSEGREDLENAQDLANKNELEYFFEHLFSNLENTNFFKIEEKTQLMKQNIKNIFHRIPNLSKSEIQTLRGILSGLNKKI